MPDTSFGPAVDVCPSMGYDGGWAGRDWPRATIATGPHRASSRAKVPGETFGSRVASVVPYWRGTRRANIGEPCSVGAVAVLSFPSLRVVGLVSMCLVLHRVRERGKAVV